MIPRIELFKVGFPGISSCELGLFTVYGRAWGWPLGPSECSVDGTWQLGVCSEPPVGDLDELR